MLKTVIRKINQTTMKAYKYLHFLNNGGLSIFFSEISSVISKGYKVDE